MATRRDALKSLAAMAVGSTLSATGAAASTGAAMGSGKDGARKQPNILVFLTDDHARWLQQAYGNSEVKTPNMTRIAERGVRMLNAHTPSPVCSPARACFFTGRMPSQHGIHDWIEEYKASYAYPWLKGQTLISELLKGAGYHTALVGKWHCGQNRYPHPGFDEWYTFWFAQYPHYGLQNFSDNGKHVTADGLQSPFLSAQAIDFVQGHYSNEKTKDSPFFLFVGYTDTHSPHIEMPEDLVSEYDDATFRDIDKEEPQPCHGVVLTGISKDPKVERQKLQEYYAAASTVDREVGRVLDALEKTMSREDLENTIIIYTTDHGLNAEQHGIWEKGNATVPQNFFEESIMIAQAFSWPAGGIPEGLALDIPVSHCDLFQTLLEAAGATPDEATARKINSPGNSYLAHLRGDNSDPWRSEVICEYGNARMMKQDGYKLILRYPYAGIQFENELYDLKADPQENVNIYKEPEHANRIASMTKAIEAFFAVYTVPGHSGLELAKQPQATPDSPWLNAIKLQKQNKLPEDLLVKPDASA
ncbi:MAG: sulfatase-like hydrolase/transferase [Acidobacteriaceae bacterium]